MGGLFLSYQVSETIVQAEWIRLNSCDSVWYFIGVKLNKRCGLPVFFDNIRIFPASALSIYLFNFVCFWAVPLFFSLLLYLSAFTTHLCPDSKVFFNGADSHWSQSALDFTGPLWVFMGSVWPRAVGDLSAIPRAPKWIAVIRVSGVSVLVIKSQGKGYSKCHSADAQLKLGRSLQPPELHSNILGNSNFTSCYIFSCYTPKIGNCIPTFCPKICSM